MPISGFHDGDEVRTPSGLVAFVIEAERKDGVEIVTVHYSGDPNRTAKTFRAGALKLIERA